MVPQHASSVEGLLAIEDGIQALGQQHAAFDFELAGNQGRHAIQLALEHGQQVIVLQGDADVGLGASPSCTEHLPSSIMIYIGWVILCCRHRRRPALGAGSG